MDDSEVKKEIKKRASWQRFWKPASNDAFMRKYEQSRIKVGGGAYNKYASNLPEVYSGAPNRIERYEQYENMDLDSHIAASLDIISEFCTQKDSVTLSPFEFHFKKEPTQKDVYFLSTYLKKWVILNNIDSRLFDTVRNVIKFGDAFFIRDPETYEWDYVNQGNVEKVIVNEGKGKKPEFYSIRDVDINLEAKTASQSPLAHTGSYAAQPTAAFSNVQYQGQAIGTSGGAVGGTSRFQRSMQSFNIDAEHVVHISMNNGLGPNWPFGTSILEKVFKTYKQKELLEDSIIIYRIQRAPERRVFYIDVGDLPQTKAMQFVERTKNEIHQQRIPSRTGSGQSIMDASYNPLCLDMNTRIPLLDGRTLNIHELSKEYQNGKENWVYSCDPITGKIVPGNITWAGVTRKDAKVIKLTFDNDEILTCTPDHKIPILGKGFVEAKDIKLTDSLISFNQRSKSADNKDYTQIYDHEQRKWKFVHKMVADFFKDIKKHQEFTYLHENISKDKSLVHHKDFDYLNNNPQNLQWMNEDDHLEYHNYVNFTPEMLGRIVDIVKTNDSNKGETISLCDNDNILMNMFREENKKPHKGIDNIDRSEWGYSKLESILKQNGFKGWREFKKNVNQYNHKLVSIEYLNDSMEVGTITIDGNERWHNHHTFAIESGIFVKNSVLEDFFFAQRPSGAGSRVETLPGGETSWGIDELQYFDNKLARGLRVPSSYLPTGLEDGSASYNDGRVGATLIQEKRFAHFCERIQKTIISKFNEEFKLFLKFSQIHVPSDIFEIRFVPPTNMDYWKQIELEAAQISNFVTMSGVPYISKRMAMKQFLGWTMDQIAENERMIIEENPSKHESSLSNYLGGGTAGVSPDLRDVGISLNDVEAAEDLAAEPGDEFAPDNDLPVGSPISGAENTPPAPEEANF